MIFSASPHLMQYGSLPHRKPQNHGHVVSNEVKSQIPKAVLVCDAFLCPICLNRQQSKQECTIYSPHFLYRSEDSVPMHVTVVWKAVYLRGTGAKCENSIKITSNARNVRPRSTSMCGGVSLRNTKPFRLAAVTVHVTFTKTVSNDRDRFWLQMLGE